MKGIGFKLIPIISIIIFILIMTTGSLLKKPLFGDDDVIHYIDDVRDKIKNENWEMASDQLKKAQKSWKKVVHRIQFSTERSEINSLKVNLERTHGFISAKDKSGALAELSEARYIWTELGK